MNFALNMMNFALNLMNFVLTNDEFCIQINGILEGRAFLGSPGAIL